MLRDGFGERPALECLLAEIDGEAVGFALFFQDGCTFRGRPAIFVEDLFVHENARHEGVGRALMTRLAAITPERNGARIELRALTWNPARGFYERLGMAQIREWLAYRLDGEALRRLARG